jgi:putative Holliday junction resolvase
MKSATRDTVAGFIPDLSSRLFHNFQRMIMTADRQRTLLAFDYGLRKIGVATGQEVTGTASPLTVLTNPAGKPDWQAITRLIDRWQPQALVVGVPLNMDGSEQHMTHAARRFGRQLQERYNLPVFEIDERLSTIEAEDRIRAAGKSSAKRHDDAVAAQVILETWFSQQRDTGQQR